MFYFACPFLYEQSITRCFNIEIKLAWFPIKSGLFQAYTKTYPCNNARMLESKLDLPNVATVHCLWEHILCTCTRPIRFSKAEQKWLKMILANNRLLWSNGIVAGIETIEMYDISYFNSYYVVAVKQTWKDPLTVSGMLLSNKKASFKSLAEHYGSILIARSPMFVVSTDIVEIKHSFCST